jgi:tetratricopeptide (TPR) repeat protein
VRKLYALIAQCQRQLGRAGEALATCEEARRQYPDDAELLFQEALARRELHDPVGEEACWHRVLSTRDRPLFASVDTGLQGYKARHNLAVLYGQQGRNAEAEDQWRAALAERPDFFAGALCLADLYQRQGRWADLERLAQHVESRPGGEANAALLRARGLLACREFAGARQVLDVALVRHPDDVDLWTVRSHVLLQEGKDRSGAHATLRRILELDPNHAQARHNLALLNREMSAVAG